MLKWGTAFWFSSAFLAVIMGITYPAEGAETIEIASRLFIIGNFWAVAYLLDLRMQEIVQECVVDLRGLDEREEETEREKKEFYRV